MDYSWACFRIIYSNYFLVYDFWRGYQLVSALILGWSLYFSWKQLVVLEGRMGRIAGVIVLIGFSLIYFTVHNSLYKWLHTDIYQSVQPSAQPLSLLYVFYYLVVLLVLSLLVINLLLYSLYFIFG